MRDNVPISLSAGPLVETAARLSELFGYLDFRVDKQHETGWRRVDELVGADLLAGWHAELAGQLDDRRVAGSYMSNWLISTLVGAWALPVLTARRLPLAGHGDVAVRRNAGGWFDGVAVETQAVGALPGDPALAYPGSIAFVDGEALLDALALRFSALEPVIAALRETCPVGLNALWGMVADAIANQALQLARLTGDDQLAAWTDAEAIIERLAVLQPRLRARPRPFPVAMDSRIEHYEVRGTCCLYYRTIETPDRDGEGYCDNCPLRTDESRLARLRDPLDG